MFSKINVKSLFPKRVFNLLGGVNQGRGLLVARQLEKREPVALVNTTEKIECSLISPTFSPKVRF